MAVVEHMRTYGLATVSFALDIWTANYINTSFACLTASYINNANHNNAFEFKSVTLAFSSFGTTSHTGKHIKEWIDSVLEIYGLKPSDVVIVSPDAASNGLKALKMIGLEAWTCLPHKIANAVKAGLGVPTLRKKVVATAHEGDDYADATRDFEGAASSDYPPLVQTLALSGDTSEPLADGRQTYTRNPIVLGMLKKFRAVKAMAKKSPKVTKNMLDAQKALGNGKVTPLKFRDGCATRWLGAMQLLETNNILESVVKIVYNNLEKTDAEDVIASIREEWEEEGDDGEVDYRDFVPILEDDFKSIVPTHDQYRLAAELEGLLAPLSFVMTKMQSGGMLAHVVVPLCEILRVNYGRGSHSLINWRIPDRAKQFVGRAGRTWSMRATSDLSEGAKTFLDIMRNELERRIFKHPYPDSLMMGVKLNSYTSAERVFGKGEDAENLIAYADEVYHACLQAGK